jgi:hypothetical protein
MDAYWILTQNTLSLYHKRVLRLLGLRTHPLLSSRTFVGKVTAQQVQRLRRAQWVQWVEKDYGEFRNLCRETQAESFSRKEWMGTILAQGLVSEPSKNGSLPNGVCFGIIGYESDGTPIAIRRRFSGITAASDTIQGEQKEGDKTSAVIEAPSDQKLYRSLGLRARQEAILNKLDELRRRPRN